MPQQLIAATIHDQIKAADKWCLMACGARDLAAMARTDARQGGLRFRVTITGPQTKHYIVVELTHQDEYKVQRVRVKRGTHEIIVEREAFCYCDNLAEVIYGMCNK
jgi:hypothetical protein